jgi:hypothetical protein
MLADVAFLKFLKKTDDERGGPPFRSGTRDYHNFCAR